MISIAQEPQWDTVAQHLQNQPGVEREICLASLLGGTVTVSLDTGHSWLVGAGQRAMNKSWLRQIEVLEGKIK